ncbi:MAG: serine/threonine protein kinase, partial [Myxococcales bacterium]|nr:serine/threonine protein kinase [Myxococcales bacterium]
MRDTDTSAPTGEDTGDDTGDDTDPAAGLFSDFEQRRLVANARRALFGRAPTLSIGRYRVERRLGAGGMGEVYLAVDDSLERKVAVKRVRAGKVDAREQERLRREALALARLSHPHVVQVYEIGEHEAQTFIAMEYVEGVTLTAWLAEAPRSWQAILERFLAAGRGLAAIHEAGLVHRDFKPDNVLVGTDDSLRVADLGLALVGDAHEPAIGLAESSALERRSRLSTSGAIMGTLRYMPREQILGEAVDARSDQ